MKIGLQINSFTWPGGDPAIAPTLARVARDADAAGFDSIWLMDHFFQIRGVGKPEEPMLEGMTALGYLAAHTRQARLGLMVGGVPYRTPALWVKATTTLDVLTGGRAWLGIGAAWNEREAAALGIPFPPLGERFEWLEDTLRMAHGMWQGERGSEEPLDGARLHAGRLLNAPQVLSRPRVPIMIGGGGEKKTLRLVARYADASNVFGSPEAIARKFEILAQHCAAVGRDPGEIERSTLQSVDIDTDGSDRGESPTAIVDRFGDLWDAGAEHIIFGVRDVHDPAKLERLERDVIPALKAIG
ncbi:MAG TPA: TIGR03560 family F420-dependent LLM class oxidoreductase [Candidatus Limnocylindrales bacterium]|jgi:F420-dependent oxidoreductase-like protein|nr:TIGR03560 family F420-dependent LLM class oxidoreductase [Candidatus Limnocylindrales bacterium]